MRGRLAYPAAFLVAFAIASWLAYASGTAVVGEYGRLRLLSSIPGPSRGADGYSVSGIVATGVSAYRLEGGKYVVDDYVAYNGSETFTVPSEPGTDLIIVKRTDLYSLNQSVNVSVDGAFAGTWNQTGEEGRGYLEGGVWNYGTNRSHMFRDTVFRVPGGLVKSPAPTLTMSYVDGKPTVISYYYWALAPLDSIMWAFSEGFAWAAAVFVAGWAARRAIVSLSGWKPPHALRLGRWLLLLAASFYLLGASYGGALAFAVALLRNRAAAFGVLGRMNKGTAAAACFAVFFTASFAVVYWQSTVDVPGFGRLHVLDYVDVYDKASEAGHAYSVQGIGWEGNVQGAYDGGYVYIDGTRSYTGYEGFMASAEPGKDLVIVKRIDTYCKNQTVNVTVDGAYAGVWKQSDGSGNGSHRFYDGAFVVPGAKVGGPNVRLGFVYVDGDPNVNSFRYWVASAERSPLWAASAAFAYSLAAMAAILCVRLGYRLLDSLPATAAVGWAAKAAAALAAYGLFGAKYAAVLLALYCLSLFRPRILQDIYAKASSERVLLPALFISTVVLVGLIAYLAVNNYPHVVDEWAYLFQARLFASGRLSVPSPPQDGFPFVNDIHMIDDGRYYAKYSPGHAMMLAFGVLLGSAWIVPPILAALTVVAVYKLGREMFEDRVGFLAAVLCFTSPYFLLMSSMLLSHTTSLLFLTAFTLYYVRTVKRPGYANAAAAGCALGMAFLTRTLTAPLYAIPLIIHAAFSLRLRGAGGVLPKVDAALLSRLMVLCSFFCVFLIVQLGYNLTLTGDPLVFPHMVQSPWDIVHYRLSGDQTETVHDRVLKTAHNNYVVNERFISMLSDTFVGWPKVPHLLFIAVLAASFGLVAWDYTLFSVVLVLVAGYSFHWWPGVSYPGPVYYYESLAALCILTSRGIWRAYDLIGRAFARPGAYREAFALFMVVLLISGFRGLLDDSWGECRDYRNRCNLAELRQSWLVEAAPYRAAQEMWLDDAVVFVARYPFKVPVHDFAGFNSPDMDDRVLFFEDKGKARNSAWMSHFPGRSCYVYDFEPDAVRMGRCRWWPSNADYRM
jgi:hypothetical protein